MNTSTWQARPHDESDRLRAEHDGVITHLRLNRPAQRNAISATLIARLHSAFIQQPGATRVVAAKVGTS